MDDNETDFLCTHLTQSLMEQVWKKHNLAQDEYGIKFSCMNRVWVSTIHPNYKIIKLPLIKSNIPYLPLIYKIFSFLSYIRDFHFRVFFSVSLQIHYTWVFSISLLHSSQFFSKSSIFTFTTKKGCNNHYFSPRDKAQVAPWMNFSCTFFFFSLKGLIF